MHALLSLKIYDFSLKSKILTKTWYYKPLLVSGNWTVMLLSMFISFLLARKFKVRIYILLMTVVLILVSLFSIGFPRIWDYLGWSYSPEYIFWQLNLPALALSFPFHVYFSQVFCIACMHNPLIYDLNLYFLVFQLESFGRMYLTTGYIILLVSFFLLVNLVGAMLGYWISKTTFIDKLLARRKTNWNKYKSLTFFFLNISLNMNI